MGLRSDDVIVARIGVGRTRVAASKHDVLEDQYLTFNCYQLSRSVRAGRPFRFAKEATMLAQLGLLMLFQVVERV